jgi:hypothetical protein
MTHLPNMPTVLSLLMWCWAEVVKCIVGLHPPAEEMCLGMLALWHSAEFCVFVWLC